MICLRVSVGVFLSVCQSHTICVAFVTRGTQRQTTTTQHMAPKRQSTLSIDTAVDDAGKYTESTDRPVRVNGKVDAANPSTNGNYTADDEADDDNDKPLPFPPQLSRSMFADVPSDPLNPQSPSLPFDVDHFLASRKHTALEDLRRELSSHLANLRAELVELINRDYADFVNLSTNLKGLDKKMIRVREPLHGLRSEVDDLKLGLEAVLGDVEAKLRYRGQIRQKKATLQLLISISSSVQKVENLLLINVPNKTSTIMAHEESNSVKRIERVAVEYNQMLYLVNKGKDMPFVDEINWRITRIKDTLSRDLALALRETLQDLTSNGPSPKTKFALTQVFRTYALIDQTSEAEQVIRDAMVKPSLTSIVTRDAIVASNQPTPSKLPGTPTLSFDFADSNNTSIHTMDEPLARLYSKILTWVQESCGVLLDITQKALRGAAFDLLVNSIWTEVAERLNAELGSVIFAAGQPDIFHKNFSISMEFISQFEDFCGSEKTLINLRQHPSYQTFMKKWQLPVYFQLRFKQIASRCEDVFQSESSLTVDSRKGADSLVLSASQSIDQAIKTCWSKHVFVFQLSHRFWRLTLQLIQRYKSWLETTTVHLSEPKQPTSPNMSRSNSAATTDDAIEDASLQEILVVVHDIQLLNEKTWSTFNNVILRLMDTSADGTLHYALQTSLDSLKILIPPLSDRFISILSRRCIDTLRLIRSITGQYRHTNKKAPTEASYFVPNILKPLKSVIEGNSSLLIDELKLIWVEAVAEAVTTRYTAVASDLLVTIKKTEDSLKRLKKGKQSTFGGLLGGREDSISDEDKIRLQCYYDIEAYGKDLAASGIQDVHAYAPFTELHALVKDYASLATRA